MKHPKTFSLPARPSSSSSEQHSSTSPSELERKDSGEIEHVDFVELLGRSCFSFLQGASQPDEMVLRAKALGYAGLAICDVNGLYGVVRGFQAAERPSAFDAEQLAAHDSQGRPKKTFHYICGAEITPFDSSPVTLIPMNKDGYVRLCHLITQAKRRAPKGHIVVSLDDICRSNEDLIAIPLPPWKEADLKKIQNAFQDRVYLPVCKDLTWDAVRLYQLALKFESLLGIELFATQRPLFHASERKPLHDVLTCIQRGSTLDAAATDLTLNGERYLKPLPELAKLHRERPDLITRTRQIASRVSFRLTELRYRYPQENLPFGRTPAEHLRILVEKGLEWRYPKSDANFMTKVKRQVDHELSVIGEMEYEDYFLTLYDICQFATREGIIHQGRGSAANSVVCFALGLTNIDPIGLKLLFERFISRERGEPPDIDIDFEHERREEVIQYIYSKYGARHAAMVCTVICYRSRMAIREVAKVMGLDAERSDALVKHMGREGLSTLIDNPGDVEKYGLTPERFQLLLRLSMELQGVPRHLGIHTGGFVISNDPVIDIVPVESATMEGRYVVQWNKDDIDTLGLMKIDVLGLGMLTALGKTLALLKQHDGIDWNLAQVPHEDETTYDMICKADTIGVFQIESRAQMSLLPRLRPRKYYDLVIEVAIVRPGPIQGGMVHPYLKRRSGREKVTYAHPSLEPILSKTLGVALFQEQIMQIVMAVAGFTAGEADELRRIMSSAWKRKPVMDGLRNRVISGMLSNGITRTYAEQIFKTIEGFASYGFPESHAASFALITYISCYLKRHHPDAFTCALLNSQPMGFYSPRQLIADAQRHGVVFRTLDVQVSEWDYTLEERVTIPTTRTTKTGLPLKAVSGTSPSMTNNLSGQSLINRDSVASLPTTRGYHAVRVGFRAIHGLRHAHALQIIEERKRNGHFKDLSDFIRRTRLPRASVVRLAAAGAFASFGHDARQVLWLLQGSSFDPQSLFFGRLSGLDDDRAIREASEIPTETNWETVKREYEMRGFSVESHPMAVLRPELMKHHRRYSSAQMLEKLRHRDQVRVAGLMSLIQRPPTANGMCFVSLEDETGILNVIITPDIYQHCRTTLLTAPLIEVEGWLESREGVRHVRAKTVRPLDLPPNGTSGGTSDGNTGKNNGPKGSSPIRGAGSDKLLGPSR